MNRTLFLSAILIAATCVANPATATEPATPTPTPHCQVPCGIYGDQLRFQGMLEDTKTIAKAIAEINGIAESLGGGSAPTAKGMNQMVRWVSNKESHAQKIQDVMGEYFFAQRIKSDHKDYTGQLATAHKVIVTAMKCKQDASAETAKSLETAILDFYRAYEGKEPDFHEDEK